MWNMMCDVMPTIAEDSLGQRGQFSADEANFEQLMVNILDERDKLLETLRDTQENLANSHIKLNDLTKEKEALQRQLQANLPQVFIYFFIFFSSPSKTCCIGMWFQFRYSKLRKSSHLVKSASY